MTIASKSYLKSRFQRGDIPTEADFHSFIDASYNDIAPNAGFVTTPTVQESESQIKMGAVDISYHPDINNLTITDKKSIIESDWLTITPDVTNYVFVDAVSGVWLLSTEVSAFNWFNTIPYMIVIRRSGSNHLHKQLITSKSYGDIELHHQRVFDTDNYARGTGALENLRIDTFPNIEMNGGIVWSGNNPILISPLSSATEQYVCIKAGNGQWYYYDFYQPILDGRWSAGSADSYYFGNVDVETGIALDATRDGWPFEIVDVGDTDWTAYGAPEGFQNGDIFQAVGSIPITGTGILTTFLRICRSTRYSNVWLYRGIENEDHFYTFYQTTRYDNLDQAMADATIPEVPPLVAAHAILVGRICYQGQVFDGSGLAVQSAWKTGFAGVTAATLHDQLSGRNDGNNHPQYGLKNAGSFTGDSSFETLLANRYAPKVRIDQLNVTGSVTVSASTHDYHYITYSGGGVNVDVSSMPGVEGQKITIVITRSGGHGDLITFDNVVWEGGATPTFSAFGYADVVEIMYVGSYKFASVKLGFAI